MPPTNLKLSFNNIFRYNIPLYLQSHLQIQPAFLLCLMDYIPGLTVPDQERRLRIVVLYVLFHKCRIRIGIAVPAKMSTGIICSDICPHKTGCTWSPETGCRDYAPAQSLLLFCLSATHGRTPVCPCASLYL